MLTRLRNLALAAMALAVAGACTPESIRPLPEELHVPADERLVGTWRAVALGNQYLVTVTRGANDALNVVMRTSTVPSGDMPPTQSRHQLRFYDINGTKVIAEHGPALNGDGRAYRYAAYDISADGNLTLRFASERAFAYYVLPSKLAGEVRARGPVFHDFLLTAYTENIVHVLRTVKPAEMFNVTFGPFVRQ